MNAEGKIDALNRAIGEMLDVLVTDVDAPADIRIGVIGFGGKEAFVHLPLTSVSDVKWSPLPATGKTPLGSALEIARDVLEDEAQVPTNSYYPLIVCLSDGLPTDEWKDGLAHLSESRRGGKATRIAVGIGADADYAVLSAVATDGANGVLRANEVRQIHNFFRWLTVTIGTRSRAPSPNKAPLPIPASLDDIDF